MAAGSHAYKVVPDTPQLCDHVRQRPGGTANPAPAL